MKDNFKNDVAIVEAINNSNHIAFKELYFKYFEALYSFLWRKLRNSEIAEDLTQDVFARTWKNRENLDSTKSIKAYLYQAALNLFINQYKKDLLRDTDSLESNNNLHTTDKVENFDLSDHLNKAINNLEEKEQYIFMLSRFEGLKYSEIAEIQDISVKTVEKYMSRALKKLRKDLKIFNILICSILLS